MKKVLMIIPKTDFRDEELFTPLDIFEDNNIAVTVVSSSLGQAKGMLGGSFKVEKTIDAVKASDFDAVVFVGGGGAQEYWDDATAHKIAQDAAKQGKVVAAICIAPVTLANAGVLRDKKATVWYSEGNLLQAKGAIYTGKDVEVDGKIVTADGPNAAEDFAMEVLRALKK